ncbi:MAG: hypothetical protein NWQ72_03980, partial [Ilumatobacteraceae bacterium]|nr:hypothetical protein [Ilumatobacteraceae bacterium]
TAPPKIPYFIVADRIRGTLLLPQKQSKHLKSVSHIFDLCCRIIIEQTSTKPTMARILSFVPTLWVQHG